MRPATQPPRVALTVRLPRAMHQVLRHLATVEQRSLTAQIVALIQEAFAAREAAWDARHRTRSQD